MKSNIYLILFGLFLLSATGFQANSQEKALVALLPNVTGFDTGKHLASASDFSVFKGRPVKIEKSTFVSPEFLPELYPTWIAHWGDIIGWFPVSDVFRGNDVYSAWVDTLSYGVICKASVGNDMPFLGQNIAAETCAYTSREESVDGVPSIFYCVFWRAGGIDSERQCVTVAHTLAGDEKILAVRQGPLPQRGAGGEAFWYCVFPNVPSKIAAAKIRELMDALTEGGGVSFVNDVGNRHLVGAQAMNLRSYHDQYFVKLSVMGDITDLQFADKSYAVSEGTGFEPNFDLNQINGSMFAYYRSFTVSPRFTTSVIEYREPSSFVEEQIQTVYAERVMEFYEKNFPGYEWQFFLI